MAIHDEILAFLRDAQFRIAELTWEINEDSMIGEIESPAAKHEIRMKLVAFIQVLYEVNLNFHSSYNFVLTTDTVPIYAEGWDEQFILEEMEHLRDISGMGDYPLISFGPYWTEVINIISPTSIDNSGGINITGTFGQFIMFNNSNEPIAVDIDEYGGMLPNETITNYFAGRV